MKLLRCHIDNFGKLTDYTVDFTENPQVFYEPNGWGKSTLAAFIKVMFYGFANESKRGATLEKERVRYKPWQGGVYGGEIMFEAGGKTYLMNRTFGSKEAEDSFALYDGVTNLPSGDYTANIGEELFQINQESFLRTVFLAQNVCDTATTDSINAKIGNLADNLDDINNYEKVQKVLKDMLNSMSPTRKTGSLKQKKEEIAQLKDELRKAGAIELAVVELEEKVTACGEERTKFLAERKDAQAKWELLTAKKAVEAKKNHYDSIVTQCREKESQVEGRLSSMGGQVPDKEELSAVQRQYKLWQDKESEVLANVLQESEQAELSRLKEQFAIGLPEADVLKETREALNQLERLRLEAAGKVLDEGEMLEKKRLEEQFANVMREENDADSAFAELDSRLDESLQRIRTYIEQKNALSAKKATLSSLKSMEQQQKVLYKQQEEQRLLQLRERRQVQQKRQVGALAVLIVGLILVVAGGALIAWGSKSAGISLLCVGVISVVMGLILLGAGRKGQEKLQQEAESVQPVGPQADESINTLEQEIAKDEEQMARDKDFVETVLAGLEEIEETAWEDSLRLRDKLYGLKDSVKRLQRLRAKEADYQAKGYEAKITQAEAQIAEVLKPIFGPVETARMRGLLAALIEDRDRFMMLTARENKCDEARSEGEKYRQQVTDYLIKYQHQGMDLYEELQKLASILTDYENDCRDLDRLRAEKADFEAANDIKAFERDIEGICGSEEELKSYMDRLDENLSMIGEQIQAYRRQLEDKQAEWEELVLQKEQLALAEEEFEEKHTYYKRIGYVSEYLEKAKESLSARYIGPVLDSFKRNYELLSGESGEDFRMDANIHVTKRAMGEQRETGAFSAGNRDLINIVLRVALVDAMYQKEKPFLIIDDSFVNMDGNRLETAGKFMKQIAQDYQVIYFTCHESRLLKD